MKNTNKVQDLIESLINLIKRQEIKWISITNYLDRNRNESLRRYMIDNDEYYDNPVLQKKYLLEYNSYCMDTEFGLIYIFSFYNKKRKDKYYILGAQNSSESKIIELNTETDYQEKIKTLIFHIKNQFDSIDLLVDEIISKGKINY